MRRFRVRRSYRGAQSKERNRVGRRECRAKNEERRKQKAAKVRETHTGPLPAVLQEAGKIPLITGLTLPAASCGS